MFTCIFLTSVLVPCAHTCTHPNEHAHVSSSRLQAFCPLSCLAGLPQRPWSQGSHCPPPLGRTSLRGFGGSTQVGKPPWPGPEPGDGEGPAGRVASGSQWMRAGRAPVSGGVLDSGAQRPSLPPGGTRLWGFQEGKQTHGVSRFHAETPCSPHARGVPPLARLWGFPCAVG